MFFAVGRIARLALKWLLPICGMLCRGQTPPHAPSAGSAGDPAREVVIDFVARDKKGNPVEDLRPEDLRITDDGSQVKIGALRYISGGAQARVISLVFDQLSEPGGKLAREAVEEMLRSRDAGNVVFAVFRVSSRLQLVQFWTTDRALVERAADAAALGARAHNDFALNAAEFNLLRAANGGNPTPALADAKNMPAWAADSVRGMAECLHQSEQIASEQQAPPALASLMALANEQERLPGRRAIVYFSEGVPATAGTRQTVGKVVSAANRSGVSVYTVDVRPLHTGPVMGTSELAAVNRWSVPDRAEVMIATSELGHSAAGQGKGVGDISGSGLLELARGTGGFSFGESSDVRKYSRRIMEEVAGYYEVSYAPAGSMYDGRFHPLVFTALRANVTVQARSGYVALPPGTPPGMQLWEAALLKDIGAARPPVAVDFRADVLPFGRTTQGTAVSLVVEAPLRQFEYHEDGNTKTFEMHPMMLALLRDASGTVLHKFSQDVPSRGAVEAMEDARNGVCTMQRSFTAKPGKYELDVAVSDALGGRTGARRIAVLVPAVGRGLALSEFTLVRRFEPMPESAVADPFAWHNTRVVPTLDRTISKDKTEAIRAFLIIYPNASSKEKPRLELDLTSLGHSVAHAVTELPAAEGAVIPYMASIPSVSLSPGLYEISATVSQGSEVVRQKTSFALEGNAKTASAGAAVIAGTNVPAEAEESAAEKGPEAKLRETITGLPIENASRPNADEEKRIVAVARKRALEYESTLPSFTCIQKTRRLTNSGNRNKWRFSDDVSELLRYSNHEEHRETLVVNGDRVNPGEPVVHGLHSTGEFGVLLHTVFAPEENATFTWKGMVSLTGHTCHLFAFHINARTSQFSIKTGLNGELSRYVACHGTVYIDASTYSIRRVSIEAEDVPPSFRVQASSMWVAYELMQVGEHEFMEPSAAEVEARTARGRSMRNEITFSNYRRYGAESSVNFANSP